MKFKKQDLQEMVYEDSELLEKIESNFVEAGRWSNHFDAIFKDTSTGKHYVTKYSKGATEMQDEQPFEYGPDEIECNEVELREVTTTEWVCK